MTKWKNDIEKNLLTDDNQILIDVLKQYTPERQRQRMFEQTPFVQQSKKQTEEFVKRYRGVNNKQQELKPIAQNFEIHRVGGFRKFFSFGENNKRLRRMNQLAKIMNNEFTKNMQKDQKEDFKKASVGKRKMRQIKFKDLIDIANIGKGGCCCGEPLVK